MLIHNVSKCNKVNSCFRKHDNLLCSWVLHVTDLGRKVGAYSPSALGFPPPTSPTSCSIFTHVALLLTIQHPGGVRQLSSLSFLL